MPPLKPILTKNRLRGVMGKYQDKSGCAFKSTVSKYKRGENPRKRHARRLQQNKEHLDVLRKWCDKNKVTFKVFNDWQHWRFAFGDRQFDWWPQTAKLVIDKQWKRGIHVHDYTQLIKIIEKEL